MHIHKRDENAISVFVLRGHINTPCAVDMDLALQAEAAEGKHNMVLDMAQVPYISGVGLSSLTDVLVKNRQAGGDLKLVALHKQVLRALRIVGYDEVFSIYATTKAAIADF